MRKKWFCGILAGILCANGTILGAAEASYIPVYVNEVQLEISQAGIMVNDVTLIPIRALAEQLGCVVAWNEENQGIGVTDPVSGRYFAVYIDQTEAYDQNGVRYELECAPKLMADRNGNEVAMVPVRFAAEMLGKEIAWDEVTETVFINSPLSYSNIENTERYRKEWFGREIRRMRSLTEQGMYYEAEAVRSSIPMELLTEAKELAPDYLSEYFSVADNISANLKLMEQGKPNQVEQEYAATQAKIEEAQGYYNQELYYETGYALDGIESYRRTAEQDQAIADLRLAAAEGIQNIPNVAMEKIRGLLRDAMYYEAYAGIEAVLQQDITEEQRQTAAALRQDIVYALDAYEKAQNITGVLYVTNVADSVNFRIRPEGDSALISTIGYGSPVDFVALAQNGYYQVKSNGKNGYIASQFLSEDRPASSVIGTRYSICLEPIALLAQPSVASGVTILRWIDYADAMSLIDVVNEQFARVKFDGDYGYVERQYLSDQKP